MPYYIRKINRAQWSQTDPSTRDIAADAITNCLQTKKNQLSVWMIENFDDQSINEVCKAMISTFTAGIDSFDIVILEESEIQDTMQLSHSETNTPYTSMSNNHFDITDLTLSKLSILASIIYSKFDTSSVRRISKGFAKDLMRDILLIDPNYRQKVHEGIAKSF